MLGKACGVVVGAEELSVGAEQVKPWLTQCLVPSCTPLMPATRCVSCSFALSVSCWLQDPWEGSQLLFVVPENSP